MARPAFKVVPPPQDEPPSRWQFAKIGMSYRVNAPDIETDITVSHIKRTSGELHADLKVSTMLEGIKTGKNGVLHAARFNLSSSTARERLAKVLEGRTPGRGMDWFDGLEMLCQDVLDAESVGQPYQDIGDKPMEQMAGRMAIDPLVAANVATLLYGPGGAGKSILALACALSVRTGREIIPGAPPAIKGNILYLDWETDAPVINERVQAICAGAGIDAPRIVYRRCIRPLAAEAEEIANAVAEREVRYVVIDSAGMALGGQGEHGDVNESTLRMFDAIRHIGVTTQVIDHVSKQEMRSSSGKVVGRLPYGSIYKINLARSAWELRNGAETTNGGNHSAVTLLHTKANDSRLHPGLDVVIDWSPGSIAFHKGEPNIEPVVPKSEKIVDRLIDYVRQHPWSSQADIIRGTGLASGTVKVYLTRRPSVMKYFAKDEQGRYGLTDQAEDRRFEWSDDLA